MTKIWQLRNDYKTLNDVAPLVFPEKYEIDMSLLDHFECNGKPLRWREKHKLEVFKEKRRKKAKPRADVSALIPGAFVLNQKAFAQMGKFLKKFGQLKEVDVEGQTEYLYNVTNVLSCIDKKRSEYAASGRLTMPFFDPQKIPGDPVIFKDEATACAEIYVNAQAKELLEKLIQESKITGLEFKPQFEKE